MHEPSCKANHEGSAGSMEVVGDLRIFPRSVEKYGARYINYYGDGGSKSYDVVKNVYPGMTVEKYERIGHYQKRVGNRLRKLRARTKGLGEKNKKIPKKDGDKSKFIKAKSRLTDSILDKLQNYFGIALRIDIGNLKNMQNAILASLFHVASATSNQYHEYCPKTPDSWCQYQLDVLNKTNLYTPGAGIFDDVIHSIKPIYADITKTEALQKCLHGLTQNPNESFNSTIWLRAHKTVYCGLDTLEFSI